MSSASLFMPRGTCYNSKPKNCFSILHTSSRYASMCSSSGLSALLEKLTRSCESPLMMRRFTLSVAAAFKPAMRPLYSAMLLETFLPC